MNKYITNVVVGALMLSLSSGVLAAEKDKEKGGNSGGVSALEARIADLEASNTALQAAVSQLLSEFGSHIVSTDAHHAVYTDAEAIAAVGPHVAEYTDTQAIAAVDPTNVLDVLWRQGSEVYFEGINLHVNNGGGAAGLGNLIIGFNLERQPGTGPDGLGTNNRTGTHSLVLGNFNNYSGHGGFVAGTYNEINGPYSTISGGGSNISSGYVSSISGGGGNIATQSFTSVTGGLNNEASAFYATVSGGSSNVANGSWSSVSGGANNQATDQGASVSGGALNEASGPNASISGGFGTFETDANAHPDTHN